MDIGATNDIIANLNKLILKTSYKGKEQLVLRNGNSLKICDIGSSTISSKFLSQPLYLNDIFHVPAIIKKLLSIFKFTKDNNVVEFYDDCCLVKDKNMRKILMLGKLKGGLYQLDVLVLLGSLKYISNSGSSFPLVSLAQVKFNEACTKIMNTWHGRLGHPHVQVLNKVLRNLNLSVRTKYLQFCDACHYKKVCQTNFLNSLNKTFAPLEIVYYDIWGPSPTFSTKGY